MTFISRRTNAKFYNGSQMTFLVQKDCIDIIFKISRGVYLTVSVYTLSEERFLLACVWGEFWNRLKCMKNRQEVLRRLKDSCPLTAQILSEKSLPHLAYIDKKKKQSAIVLEMKAIVLSNSIADYLHEQVVSKAMDLMNYNLDLYCELEAKCPFPIWKHDLKRLMER